MLLDTWLPLTLGGFVSGVLAGFLGIGGGLVLVPLQVTLGISAKQAVGTSNLAIVLTSIAGSIQNWRAGHLNLRRVLLLGLPSVLTAQLGVWVAVRIPSYLLLGGFGLLMLLNIYLVDLRDRLVAKQAADPVWDPTVARLFTGGSAGLLAGVFGIGGGAVMVALQILLMAEPIKTAIQTSLGVIVITAASALGGHALAGNVLPIEGMLLGLGGLIGVQISTRILPKLPDAMVSILFRSFLGILSLYLFWQAWQAYQQ